MKFAKYYDATNILNNLLNEGKLNSYEGEGEDDYCEKLYICQDTHDFWICRVLSNLNEQYDYEDGKWLIERNKIDKYDVVDFIKESSDELRNKIGNLETLYRQLNIRMLLGKILSSIDDKVLLEKNILLDDNNGLENWDCLECDSIEECIENIDGGFGIEKL